MSSTINFLEAIQRIRRTFCPPKPTRLSYQILRFETIIEGEISMLVAVVELDWALSNSPNVTSQVLTISENGVAGAPVTLDAVATTYTVNIAANTDVQASLTAVNAFGASTPATLSFQIPSLDVPASQTFGTPGWKITGVLDQ